VGRLKEECYRGVSTPLAFIGVCKDRGGKSWKTGFCVINSETGLCVFSFSHVLGRGVLALDSQTRAVIFCGLQELQVSKTLLYVTSHFVKVNSPGCDFLLISKPWFTAIRCPNLSFSPHHGTLSSPPQQCSPWDITHRAMDNSECYSLLRALWQLAPASRGLLQLRAEVKPWS
jgi:hypothetical protein